MRKRNTSQRTRLLSIPTIHNQGPLQFNTYQLQSINLRAVVV